MNIRSLIGALLAVIIFGSMFAVWVMVMGHVIGFWGIVGLAFFCILCAASKFNRSR